ncbi:hypothetical protein HB912_00495 [Listeria aquatica]|uniref:Uncharacterized protein n=1 Tax=Listeria aquatica TaxID=1494960 RepID=A0A841ZKR5_9LIST|nr:hypothetical protein [Listeria aquatica]MBC1520122.1 hypothetical protein [Listeria aquatica]
MSLFSKIVNQISFEKALEKNSLNQICITLNGTGKELLSKTLKIFIFAVVSLLVCLFSSNNWFVFPIIAAIIILVTVIGYFRSSLYFKTAIYNIAIYLFVQTALIFYISSLEVTDSSFINRVIAIVYILIGYSLSFYVIKLKLLEKVQTRYLETEEKQLRKRKSIKAIRILSIVLVSLSIIIIAGMQLYRINKWWFGGTDADFLAGLNGTFAGTIIASVFVCIALLVLFLITLLPTLLLNATTVVDGYIYKKYSEDFRTEYEYTEEEWYGE